MNFPEDNTEENITSLRFAASIMEMIFTAGPMPIGAVGIIASASGATPREASAGMALIQGAGFISLVSETGTPVFSPASPDAHDVVLTPAGATEVERCVALDAKDQEHGNGNPNNN